MNIWSNVRQVGCVARKTFKNSSSRYISEVSIETPRWAQPIETPPWAQPIENLYLFLTFLVIKDSRCLLIQSEHKHSASGRAI